MLTLLLGAALLFATIDRGWFPHDEGALGQSAERVLQGQVPHRDFDEIYTGLLSYLNAGAFALGGIRLPVLRLPLFISALMWLAALYALTRRLVGPVGAAALSLLALAWAVPNYPAAIPSWYNLFLATGGCLALIRWTETAGVRWLVLAGALGGLSFLFKLSGLFFLAGAGLFLLEATRPERPATAQGRRAWWLPLTITIGLGLFVLALWRSIAPVHDPSVVLHLFAPVGLLAFGLAVREWLPPAVEAGARLNALFRAVGPLVLGAAMPVGAALGATAAGGAVDEVVSGVFAKPFRRLTFATWPAPDVYWLVAVVPLILLLRPRRDHEAPAWR
ncbi:MAG: hypothetical protein ACREN5_14810, partial [Gemmatimonadales bacterium]